MFRRTFLGLGAVKMLAASCDNQVRIRPGKLWVPNWMPVSAMLFETFNGNSKEQSAFYSETRNLENLAGAIRDGACAYKVENPLFSHVFLELGHGMHVPGMTSAVGRSELVYTQDLQILLTDQLRDIGLQVILQNYNQPEMSGGGESAVLLRENRDQIEQRILRIAEDEKIFVTRSGLPTNAFAHYSLHVDSVAYTDENKQLHIVRDPKPPMIHVAMHPNKQTMAHAHAMREMLNHHYRSARLQYCGM